jgi:hypothetical protein
MNDLSTFHRCTNCLWTRLCVLAWKEAAKTNQRTIGVQDAHVCEQKLRKKKYFLFLFLLSIESWEVATRAGTP